MSKPRENLTGKLFGRWKVIKYSNNNKWLCQCECGMIKVVNGQSLKNGKSKSCGCLQKEVASEKHCSNLIGKQFGRLKVIGKLPSRNKKSYWLCQCECGREHMASGNSLIQGLVKSCGCLFENMRKRGNLTKEEFTKKRLYGIWQGIKNRCYNKKRKEYKYYGLKGIAVCNLWINDFNSFYLWSLNNGYADNLTIDRIDNHGNYEPSNCRWIDVHEQQKNRRKNK